MNALKINAERVENSHSLAHNGSTVSIYSGRRISISFLACSLIALALNRYLATILLDLLGSRMIFLRFPVVDESIINNDFSLRSHIAFYNPINSEILSLIEDLSTIAAAFHVKPELERISTSKR